MHATSRGAIIGCACEAVQASLTRSIPGFYDPPASPGRDVESRVRTDSQVMNVPNSLTILRILLIPVYVGLLMYEQFTSALAVLVVAGVTDALDGTIARVANQRTQLGAVLDPLADKLLLMSGFITLSVMHLVPLWIVIVVVSRDAILVLGTAVAQYTDSRVNITPTILGKGTTLIQLTVLVLVVFVASRGSDLSIVRPLLYLMVGVTLLSGLHYLYRGYMHVSATRT